MNNDRLAWVALLASFVGLSGGVAGTTAIHSLPLQTQSSQTIVQDDTDIRLHNMEQSLNGIVQYIVEKEKAAAPKLPLPSPTIKPTIPNNGSKVGDIKSKVD